MYRMHPEICKFPSMHFYDNKLLNGSQMSCKSAPFHQTNGLGPYVFYDVADGREVRGKNTGAMSLCNEHEADAAVEVLRFFKKRYPTEFIGGRIGVITPYKSQLSLLRSRFLNAFGSSSIAEIEFNTVDGFQGREMDILVLSTVRAVHLSTAAPEISSSTIGFVADVRRMNVALTRAKLSLWIFGNARTLQTNHNWAALVKDAEERNLIVTAKMPYHSIFKTASKNKYILENSDNDTRQLKHEKKIKDNGRNVSKLVNGKDTFERKKKCIASEVKDKNKGHRGENAFSALERDVLCKERSAQNEHNSIKKDMFNSIDQQVCKSGREGKDKIEINRGRTILGKRQSKFQNSRNNVDHVVEETGGRHEASKLSELEGLSMCSGWDTSSYKEVSAFSMEGCHEQKDADDQGRGPPQSRVSEISKRKQQREAVDAILYSSLISTKKDEKLSKVSAKRRFSSSVAHGSMKPPKTRKDQSARE